MRTLGLPELIAESLQEYVDINVRLAIDPSWRQELAMTLRGRLEASPLMDAPGFTRDIEAGYRQMWRTWCDAQSRRS